MPALMTVDLSCCMWCTLLRSGRLMLFTHCVLCLAPLPSVLLAPEGCDQAFICLCRQAGSIPGATAIAGVERLAATVEILARLLGPNTPVLTPTSSSKSLLQVCLLTKHALTIKQRAAGLC
jgi:hypothetical protein